MHLVLLTMHCETSENHNASRSFIAHMHAFYSAPSCIWKDDSAARMRRSDPFQVDQKQHLAEKAAKQARGLDSLLLLTV